MSSNNVFSMSVETIISVLNLMGFEQVGLCDGGVTFSDGNITTDLVITQERITLTIPDDDAEYGVWPLTIGCRYDLMDALSHIIYCSDRTAEIRAEWAAQEAEMEAEFIKARDGQLTEDIPF